MEYGGPDGELAAALRYLSQRFTMVTPQAKAVLNDIGMSSAEMFHFDKAPDKPYDNGLLVYSIITSDKAKKYNSETNRVPFNAHPTVTQGKAERIINLYIATPNNMVA